MFQDFFGRGQIGTHGYRFFFNSPICLAYPRIGPILHMWSSSPAAPDPTCRGTQIILISSIYGMHRYENFATKLWKKSVGKGYLLENLILAGTLDWRCPLSPGARGFAHPEPIGVTPLVLYNKIYETHHLQWLYGARDTVIMYGNQSVSKISLWCCSVPIFRPVSRA